KPAPTSTRLEPTARPRSTSRSRGKKTRKLRCSAATAESGLGSRNLPTRVPEEALMRLAAIVVTVMLAATGGPAVQTPRTHDLALTPEHVHWGYYDARVPAVL